MDLTEATLHFIRLYGPLILVIFTFLEMSMLFPFLPSEVVVPGAAAILITDATSFLVFILAAGVGGTVGAFVPYYVFHATRSGGVGWIKDRITVSEENTNRGREWFQEWGQSSVLWGRFLPVLRSVISIPAGLARMRSMRFGVFTAIGTVGFYAATGALVYFGRQQPLFRAAVSSVIDRPALTAVGALSLLTIGVVLRRYRQS
ncbi:DedA family protein [Saliphagus infecundisoli]|uniref:DedA family protein n=1 Tax=Saliphagus infecundisoli TaxID=1849069 RepID=A0ABD5QE08_9EURY|nr:DedA family protein [Saliphagus infecundisoli]